MNAYIIIYNNLSMSCYASNQLINLLLFARRASILVFVILISIGVGQQQQAALASSYSAGYDHGCDDTKVSDSSDKYINQLGKGPSFHTSQFMNGYNNGFGACSDGHSSNTSRDNRRISSIGGGSSFDDNEDDHISSTSDKGSFKIHIILLDNPNRSIGHVKFYIQEHQQYHDTTQLNDAFSPDDGAYFPKVTFTLEIPQEVIADRETFHLCVDPDDNGQTKACYKMVKHEGNDKESITIDTGKL
jgi:hypothetical protein